MEGRLTDQYRSFDMIAVKVTDRPEFSDVSMPEIDQSIRELAAMTGIGLRASEFMFVPRL
jgi:hypothetical protein